MTPSSSPVARASDIAPGKTRRVELGDEPVLLCNVDGTLYAIEDVCTHDGGELDQGELEGCRIECPRHGAYFDVRNGDALTFPAVIPLRTYGVRVVDGDVFIDAAPES